VTEFECNEQSILIYYFNETNMDSDQSHSGLETNAMYYVDV